MKNGSSIEDKFLFEVGQKIRKRRNELGISLRELGEDLGLDKGNTHKLESGKNITLKTLLRISVFLDIKPSELLTFPVKFDLEEFEQMIMDNRSVKPKSEKIEALKKSLTDNRNRLKLKK